MLGRVLADRYRIDSLVARGGMARVYRAHDDRLDRMVAVKVLAPPYSDDSAFTERFLGEARAAASLSHPSLVHVYDSGSDGAAHFIVMELLDRHRTLRDILRDRGRLPAGEVIRIGRELLAGLRVVHEHGLVHCDVKAANVMLGPGPAKLIDFGIAQPPHQGLEGETSIGTLQSMSPEQLHGDSLTPASDLFSLGVVLYQSLTGHMPYPGTTPEAVSAAHAAESVAPPSTLVRDLPHRLDAVLLQSLRREPGGRFHSAGAMSRALEVVATDAAGSDDETRVVRTASAGRAPEHSPAAGYVPPAVPDRPPAPAPAPTPAAKPPSRQRARPRLRAAAARLERPRHARHARGGRAGRGTRGPAAARSRGDAGSGDLPRASRPHRPHRRRSTRRHPGDRRPSHRRGDRPCPRRGAQLDRSLQPRREPARGNHRPGARRGHRGGPREPVHDVLGPDRRLSRRRRRQQRPGERR
jgi:eukaryotic-like serine/threonine-protein kinase